MCIIECYLFHSDDGCTSDADSEVEELQARLGMKVPIHGSPRSGYTAHELINMIYNDDPQLKLCKEKPVGVRTFASFIVDLKCVNLKDLAADDNGVWVTSMPRRMYELKRKRGVIRSLKHISKVTADVNKCDAITICRQYGTHQATPEFRRIITTVIDSKGVRVP